MYCVPREKEEKNVKYRMKNKETSKRMIKEEEILIKQEVNKKFYRGRGGVKLVAKKNWQWGGV